MREDSIFACTNLGVFESIVIESHEKMVACLNEGKRPNGNEGFVLAYDSSHRSFKEALKVLVFVGAALESMWYQKAVAYRSKSFAERLDRECRSVAEKYESIGLTEHKLLHGMKHYYSVRRQVVHEKNHNSQFQKIVFNAQCEAGKAVELLLSVRLALESISEA
ncbi:MAG: hypothetical protein ACRBB4_11090 [Neptuniibacter sp.]